MAIQHLPRTLQRWGPKPRRVGKPSKLRKRWPGDEAMERLLRGRSLARICRVSGLSLDSVRGFFRGKQRPTLPSAVVMARALGCSVEELWGAITQVWEAGKVEAKAGASHTHINKKAMRVEEAVDWGRTKERRISKARRQRRQRQQFTLPQAAPHYHQPEPRIPPQQRSVPLHVQRPVVPLFNPHRPAPPPMPKSISNRFALAPRPAPAEADEPASVGLADLFGGDWD